MKSNPFEIPGEFSSLTVRPSLDGSAIFAVSGTGAIVLTATDVANLRAHLTTIEDDTALAEIKQLRDVIERACDALTTLGATSWERVQTAGLILSSATSPRRFCVWCQGGPANDWRYETSIEPPDEIVLYPLPGDGHSGWTRVFADDDWPGAVRYMRIRTVEQLDGECIYYPKADSPVCELRGGVCDCAGQPCGLDKRTETP